MTATATRTVQVLCREPGCTVEVRAQGFCNAHYLVWYRDERNMLEREVRKAYAVHGDPAAYFCDGDEKCKTTPDRWWVRSGDTNEPLALCQAHTEQVIYNLKQDIRRLELKP